MTTSTQFLRTFTRNSITLLSLNRPRAANALNKLLISELNTFIDEQLDTRSTRALILAGSGYHQSHVATTQSDPDGSRPVFCAGADLKERLTLQTLDEVEELVDNLRNTFQKVYDIEIPVLAAIEGACLGGGLELALAADIRVASESATLGLVETSLAIIPGAGGTQRLPTVLSSSSKAKELIFTAQKLNGKESLDLGLVDYCVKDSTIDKCWGIAELIRKNGPLAVKAAKKAINHGLQTPSFHEKLAIEKHCYASTLNTKDRLEGLEAFREKRKPAYRGQ